MDYHKHYNNLIDRAKNRTLEGYSERHHIMPKCLGGSDDKSNIVRLTAPEHFIAHKLLCFMYPNNNKLVYAAFKMTVCNNRQKRNNKLYGWLKAAYAKQLAEHNSGRIVTEETRRKQSASRLGVKRGAHKDETKQKMSLASKGKTKSIEHRQALSKARTGKKLKPFTQEHKNKMSVSIKEALKNTDMSYRQTSEYKMQQSLKMKEIWAKRKNKNIYING